MRFFRKNALGGVVGGVRRSKGCKESLMSEAKEMFSAIFQFTICSLMMHVFSFTFPFAFRWMVG